MDRSAECKRLKRFPFVCNGCPKRGGSCLFAQRFLYDPKAAQSQYESLLSSWRQGYAMTEEDKSAFDDALESGVAKGQSPCHIVKANPDAIKCSLRTVYRMIDAGDAPAKSVGLRRKVKLKPRRKCKRRDAVDAKAREGRRYEDFAPTRNAAPSASWSSTPSRAPPRSWAASKGVGSSTAIPTPPSKRGRSRRTALARCFIPNGADMAQLTGGDVKAMRGSINSYERKSMQTTYKAAVALFGEKFLDGLGIDEVGAENVSMLPILGG